MSICRYFNRHRLHRCRIDNSKVNIDAALVQGLFVCELAHRRNGVAAQTIFCLSCSRLSTACRNHSTCLEVSSMISNVLWWTILRGHLGNFWQSSSTANMVQNTTFQMLQLVFFAWQADVHVPTRMLSDCIRCITTLTSEKRGKKAVFWIWPHDVGIDGMMKSRRRLTQCCRLSTNKSTDVRRRTLAVERKSPQFTRRSAFD